MSKQLVHQSTTETDNMTELVFQSAEFEISISLIPFEVALECSETWLPTRQTRREMKLYLRL